MAKTPFGADRGTGVLLFDPEEVVIIEDRSHPRFDARIDKPLTEEFLASLRRAQLEPGIVCKDDEGNPQIVNGRRRLRGYRELNRRAGPGGTRYKFAAVYRRIDSDEDAVAARYEANLHEGDSLVDKARGAEDFMRRFGWSAEKTGILFGVGPATIKKWVAVLECAAPVVAALDAGRIGIGAALKLSELPKREQAAKLDEVTEGRAPRERAATPAKTGATKHGRPSALTLRSVAAFAKETSMSAGERAILGWALGEVTDEALVARWPQLASAFDAKSAKAAA